MFPGCDTWWARKWPLTTETARPLPHFICYLTSPPSSLLHRPITSFLNYLETKLWQTTVPSLLFSWNVKMYSASKTLKEQTYMKVITRVTTVTGTGTHFVIFNNSTTNYYTKKNSLYWQSYSGCRGCSLVLNSVNIGKMYFFSVILKLELRTFKRWEKPPFYVWYKFGQNKANGLALDEQKIRKALDSGTFLGNCIQNPRWQ